MHQLLFIGTTTNLMSTTEKFFLVLGRSCSVQKWSFVGVGFSWRNSTEHLGEEVGCPSENLSFMPLGILHILFSCNYGTFCKMSGFFLGLCFGYFHILSSLSCCFSYSVEYLDSLMCFFTAVKSKLCHHLEILLPLFYEALALFLEALIMYALCNFTIQLLKMPGTWEPI